MLLQSSRKEGRVPENSCSFFYGEALKIKGAIKALNNTTHTHTHTHTLPSNLLNCSAERQRCLWEAIGGRDPSNLEGLPSLIS
jgi:hypothetical protein